MLEPLWIVDNFQHQFIPSIAENIGSSLMINSGKIVLVDAQDLVADAELSLLGSSAFGLDNADKNAPWILRRARSNNIEAKSS